MQFQRPPVSEIPDTVEDWDFSFTLKDQDYEHPYGKFRWRLGDREWLCNRMFGRLRLDGCTSNGHMRVRGRLRINDAGNAQYAGE